MIAPISQQELESYLWGAATHLRGHVQAGDYKQFVFPLLFFKRLSDVYDEEYAAALAESGGDEAYAAFPEQHRFVIPDGAHWRDVRSAAKNVGKAIQTALRDIEAANPGKLDGIFGDAPWTNRDRLPDEMLKNLIEHFSSRVLDRKAVPEDELGNAYEFLIKKFADDSGHTAQEFYTNRTLVHLMVQMLAPKAGETIYDPTCGTGGMLISALAEVKRMGGEWRTLGLYGQEINFMTSAIARMNLLLHGVEDFEIQRGDTLADPKFLKGDRLGTFDVALANPPYSIKHWNRELWSSDPFGRNTLGTPPQGRADYAFFQHILSSLDPKAGRCAILFPHGVLFRKEEAEMRENLIRRDLVECVLGLGPGLFYNSPMEACVVICRTQKPKARRGKVLFIDAVNEIARERAQSFLRPENQSRILAVYKAFVDEPGFAAVAGTGAIERQDFSLSIPLFVARKSEAWVAKNDENAAESLASAWPRWKADGEAFWRQMDDVTAMLDGLAEKESEQKTT
jgi:type I restriction enzyme M protein